jgi:AraC family transcriptional regulator of adaptative response/methylated-DNA-[protein]-cysteine methyltransferase
MLGMNSIGQLAQPLDPEAAWQAVLHHDRAASFVYAVGSTGIFCRTGCSSRLPSRRNVLFFATAGEALVAGFRPCLRCRPEAAARPEDERAATADRLRRHLEANFDRRVQLEELGHLAGTSAHTARRIFALEMGATPLAYQRALRATRLRKALAQGDSVTNAIFEAGYGSASRAYEAQPLGMTPGRFAAGGKGERIGYAAASTPFGWIAVGATERGLCWLSLAGTEEEAVATVRAEFPAATLEADASLNRWVEKALAAVSSTAAPRPTELDLRGTAFQLRVWEALMRIPQGETRTYSQVAREMGLPNATRAVARACALNRVSLLVPCHRVVGVSGALTGYRWGVERKRKLLEAERAAVHE